MSLIPKDRSIQEQQKYLFSKLGIRTQEQAFGEHVKYMRGRADGSIKSIPTP